MALDLSGGNYGLWVDASVVSGYPFTLVGFGESDGATSFNFISLQDQSGFNDYQAITATTASFRATSRSVADGLTNANANVGAFSNGDWLFVGGVFPSPTLRWCYGRNLTQGDELRSPNDTTSVSFSASTIDSTSIGFQKRDPGSERNFAPLRIARCAAWNVALTEGELVAIGRGKSPLLVRPQALVIYVPGINLNNKSIGRRSWLLQEFGGTPMLGTDPPGLRYVSAARPLAAPKARNRASVLVPMEKRGYGV